MTVLNSDCQFEWRAMVISLNTKSKLALVDGTIKMSLVAIESEDNAT